MINKDIVHWDARKHEQAIVDASDLGLPPGKWPDTLVLSGPEGVDVMFALRGFNYNADNEIVGARYGREWLTVLVVND